MANYTGSLSRHLLLPRPASKLDSRRHRHPLQAPVCWLDHRRILLPSPPTGVSPSNRPPRPPRSPRMTSSTSATISADLHQQLSTSKEKRKHQAQMEAIVAESEIEEQEPKTPAQAVAQVLSSSNFLQNVDIMATSKRSDKAVDASRVKVLEAELEVEKQVAAEVRDELDALEKKVGESEEARAKELEEIENLKKRAQDTDAVLRRLLSLTKE